MKKRPIIWRVLPWVLLVAIIGGIGYVGYLLWGKPEAEPLYTAEIVRFEEENAEPIILDNGKLHLEMDPMTTQFVLTDAYGHDWKSNPFSDPATSGEKVASGENKNAIASPLNIYYRLPKKSVDNMYDAYTYSISRSAYRINKVDDSTVEVTYSLGDIATEYLLPDALTQERYSEMSDAVKASGSNKAKFTGKYTGKKNADIQKALSGGSGKDDAMELVEAYPQIVYQDIRLVSAKDNNGLSALEELLKKTEYTEEEKNLDIILSRSTYRYTYHKYTPDEISSLQAGSPEEQQLAAAVLEKNPNLAGENGYILQRSEQVITPGRMEALLAGSEAQVEFANQLIESWPDIQSDPYTVIPLAEGEADKLYTVAELIDEEFYPETELLLECGIFEAAEKPVDILFDATVRYRLDGEDFVAELPYDQLKYNSAYTSLSYVSMLPMFGAVGAQEDGTYEDGYLLVPEGGGALIRFNNQKLKQTGYYADVYGYDYGIKRPEFVSESKTQIPVFGILRKEQSFLCVVEGASSYVSIRADINGKGTGTERSSYNYVQAKAQVLHVDQYNVSAKTAELQLMYEKKIPDTTLVQRYRFTDNDDYTKLAGSYREYLQDKYPRLKESKASERIPVSVELIGAIDKRVVVAGLPVQKVFSTTTFSQGSEIISALTDSGVSNLNVRYAGWLRGGVKQKALTGVHVLKELGGEKALRELISSAKNKGVKLFFDGITSFVYDSGLIDGFITSRDAARHITREVAEISMYSPVFYTEDEDMGIFYLAHPSYAKNNADRLVGWLKDKGAQGVSFRDIGYMLSADYDPNRVVTREEVKEMNIRTLEEARKAGEQIMIKEGFDFTLPHADIITDMDLTGNRYVLIDHYIPFYQIAIHGLVDYTGQALNVSGDYQTELLRSVEYGAGLNYTFTAENAAVTQETNYTGFYGITYDSWKEEARDTILRYQKETDGLNRQQITGHEELSDYVKVTTYEDGTRIYVNYGTENYNGDVEVPARDYVIIGKEDQ